MHEWMDGWMDGRTKGDDGRKVEYTRDRGRERVREDHTGPEKERTGVRVGGKGRGQERKDGLLSFARKLEPVGPGDREADKPTGHCDSKQGTRYSGTKSSSQGGSRSLDFWAPHLP